MRYDPPQCCPPQPHPPLPDIAAGQSHLTPRQLLGFPQWRAALLSDVLTQPALKGWSADAAGDLGVMLLEFWAYVLDVTAFYDARIAERSYLGTARDEKVAREIAGLIGFVPRPALSAMVELALRAQGDDPVLVGAQTAFRSEAFGDEPPQIFETSGEQTVWPQRNRWRVARYRSEAHTGPVLRFRAGEGPSRGSVLAILVDGRPAFAGKVASVRTEVAGDGQRYQRVEFSPGTSLAGLEGVAFASMQAFSLGFRTGLSQLVAVADRVDVAAGTLILDGVYPQIVSGQLVVLESGGMMHAATVDDVDIYRHELATTVDGVSSLIPFSQVTMAFPAIDPSPTGSFLHLGAYPLGRPTRPAQSEIGLADMAGGIALSGPVQPLLDAPMSGLTLAVGERARGARLPGTVTVEDDGSARFLPDATALPFEAPLVAPVTLFGNVVTALRGETVRDELLGSGDASRAFQSFKLKKKPLSWVADGSVSLGRRPRVSLLVDGIYWRWVETLYGHGPDERVFIVEMEADGTAHIRIGDGLTGSRLPTGVGNIRATYAFGAGAAKPPADSIKQLIRPPRGITHVASPLAAYGGADAQHADEIAALAPGSTLVLDRAVSAADYLAMARNFSGALNAAVAKRWDASAQADIIEISYISDGGDIGPALAAFLEMRSAPGVAIRVRAATRIVVSPMEIALGIDPAFAPQGVRDAVAARLFDARKGLLSAANIPIGAPLFRSALLAAIHAEPGVVRVESIAFGGEEMPYAKAPGTGAYFDLISAGRVI